jgi:hypothetical protein
MAVGISPLVIYLNEVDAAYGVALAAVVVYCAIGASIIGYYMGTHLDDIPVRASRRDKGQA